ncbi:MAG: hypothetical protein FWF31_11680 [Desulfobulbus sp.]|nr:hypothetical protein [Desulfobulbus sp.]
MRRFTSAGPDDKGVMVCHPPLDLRSKLRIQEIKGERIVFPSAKAQKKIFEAFELDVPV